MADELRLPDLAPEGYAEIFEALRNAIPTFSSNWTDYNASDPGITLLQLLAWVGEATAYRVDRVPDASFHNFLLMAAGVPEQGVEQALLTAQRDIVKRGLVTITLGGQPVLMDPAYVELLRYLVSILGQDVDAAQMHAVAQRYWSSPYRAVTREDFEALSLQCSASVPDTAPFDKVMRAFVHHQEAGVRVTIVSGYVPLYSLKFAKSYTTTTPAEPDPAMYGTLTVSATPPSFSSLNGYDKLVYAVGAFLAPRQLIGTAVSVEAARFTPLVASVDLVVARGYDGETVLRAAAASLIALTDPLKGGSDGDGWTYGQPLLEHDLLAALGGLPGIDPSFPLVAQVDALNGTRVGDAAVGVTTVVESPPYDAGFPWFVSLTLRALYSTWTIQVGVHGRVAMDTRIPFEEDA
ncbi:hypothetical protein D7V97_39900 [Corallococcus sp. CA053C]|uniref:hypothetical protein n=1 Tax=Corallococcus sp. CA053C TaxID=2316732 RepID=UPI000EA21FC1|nr:hypothetical protein [Corallococcus sp. CA053C]RKG93561.1 hypothetical protein D7V97_39900 [Corallococcus sp. CA053C]